MTKRIQSIVYFALLIIACLVYTATDSTTTGDNEFSTNKTEIIKKNTISLNTY
ncbi:hypothetical protein I2486_04010 [Cellulophaga sp. E16_2]|uniref:hypothetical protein n=1 Tax=unclassified Cellulophaga TaxID=2634405 RepID=UPI0013FD7B6C|nr:MULTISPECIES: hypothetical protein [unclassified Cellulophaga]MBO0590564.1 hypothetical protein [Cellulophaga sp. E16_2]